MYVGGNISGFQQADSPSRCLGFIPADRAAQGNPCAHRVWQVRAGVQGGPGHPLPTIQQLQLS